MPSSRTSTRSQSRGPAARTVRGPGDVGADKLVVSPRHRLKVVVGSTGQAYGRRIPAGMFPGHADIGGEIK